MKIIAIMGKAGSGKDTILRLLMDQCPEYFNEIVSCTTRPPREGEQDGINYHFLTVPEFTKKVLNGDMLEATQFNGWFYGTAKSRLSEDKVNIGVFNPAGVRCLMESSDIDLTVYYVVSSDKERLIRQLTRESDPNISEIIRRYKADEDDFADLDDIDYIKLNNRAGKYGLKKADNIPQSLKDAVTKIAKGQNIKIPLFENTRDSGMPF